MNEREHDSFEAELFEIRPAKVPDDFAKRLAAFPPRASASLRRATRLTRVPQPAHPWQLLRWLVPAMASAAGLVAIGVWRSAPAHMRPASTSTPTAVSAPAALRADEVEIGRQLIGTFETVATLASGEPIRLRCREWMDQVVLRDTAHGLAIERRTPRFEVLPVSFETF